MGLYVQVDINNNFIFLFGNLFFFTFELQYRDDSSELTDMQ